MVVKTGISQEGYILLATRMGEIKRMDFSVLANIRSNGLIAMDIEDGDEVISAWQAGENDDVVMVSEKGMAARFPIARVPTRQRPAGGVRGMRLDPGDRVVSMDVVIPGAQLLVVSRNGLGKLTPITSYRQTGRDVKGVTTLKITDKTGPVATAHLVQDATEVLLVSEKGVIVRVPLAEIRSLGRITQGVKIMNPDEGDYVATATSMNTNAREEKVGRRNSKCHRRESSPVQTHRRTLSGFSGMWREFGYCPFPIPA